MSGKAKKIARVLDLTRRMDSSLRIYREEGYSDPPFVCSEWSTIEDRGYRVSRLELGTQTGTHIDAPAHFDPAGATLDFLSVERLVGDYHLFDLPERVEEKTVAGMTAGGVNEPILFFRTYQCRRCQMTAEALDALIALPSLVWVMAGQVTIQGQPGFEFHRALARAGKFLVEDLEPSAAAKVPARGEIFAFPLPLVGASGAPCRVVVREAKAANS